MNSKNTVSMYLLAILTFMSTFCLSDNIATIFSHGIAATRTQVNGYVKSYKKHDITHYNDRYVIYTPYVTFNYPDATNKFYRVNYNETSFGQENEISRLNKAYEATLAHYDDCNIILYGLSRGASNVLIFAGLYQPHSIKALVIESPYFTMGQVISNIMIKNNLGWLPLSYGETIAEFIFKKYTRYGHSPANCIKNISKDIPIFIICSKQDHLVPYESSVDVYKELVKSGHEHTYIFITDQGKHAAILQGSDGEQYQYVINAFYKKYNLPYCANNAKKGESLLALCQPKLN